jgi:putative membrane protein
MLRLAAFLGLLGLAAATAIIVYSGYAQILQALGQAGWGILFVSLYHLIPMLCCVIGWRILFTGRKRPTHVFLLYVLWLRSAVNGLMPVARIGGELVAVRVMLKHGIRKSAAVATTIVELTMSVIGVFIFDASGIGLFVRHIADRQIGWQLLIGLALSIPAIAALVVVQRAGFFGLLSKIFALMFRDNWAKFTGNAAQLDRAVHTLYRRHGRIVLCGLWQLATWFAGIGEVALGLNVLGHPLPLVECMMLEALIQASASVAFAVPGALGVQEAGFLLFGHMLGLPPDIATALAVMRRCRDLLIFVPGLVVWQAQEGRWLLAKPRR